MARSRVGQAREFEVMSSSSKYVRPPEQTFNPDSRFPFFLDGWSGCHQTTVCETQLCDLGQVTEPF